MLDNPPIHQTFIANLLLLLPAGVDTLAIWRR
jgi:hypothetical protein